MTPNLDFKVTIFWTSNNWYSYSYNGRLIESRIWSVEWCHFQWPWMTLNPDFMARLYSTFNVSLIQFFMLSLKTKRRSTLTGCNVRLSNLYWLVLEFLCLHQSRLAETQCSRPARSFVCSLVRSLVYYQSCEHDILTSSSAIAKRPREALSLSVVMPSFNSTKRRV